MAVAASLFASPVTAQDTATDQTGDADLDPSVVEEVIVTGTRRALELAVDTKRESDSIMDGIASEGIGKFPDLSLGEALASITGV